MLLRHNCIGQSWVYMTQVLSAIIEWVSNQMLKHIVHVGIEKNFMFNMKPELLSSYQYEYYCSLILSKLFGEKIAKTAVQKSMNACRSSYIRMVI